MIIKGVDVGISLNNTMRELHDTFWEVDANIEGPYAFPEDALRNASKIMMVVLMDELWKRIQKSNIDQSISEVMARDLGKEFREFIEKWSQRNPKDFYEDLR